MCPWMLFPANQLAFGLNLTTCVMTLFPEGSPKIFLAPPHLANATWQCWEGESLWAAAAGVERKDATLQTWGGLGDFGPHSDTQQRGLQEPLKPMCSLKGWCNTPHQFSAHLGEEGLWFLIRLGLGEEKNPSWSSSSWWHLHIAYRILPPQCWGRGRVCWGILVPQWVQAL